MSEREPQPVVWQGLHKMDAPNEKPLIFCALADGERWVSEYKPGFAQLVPLCAPDARYAEMRAALELIAAPMRPDGTWNRDREACRELAARVLELPT